LEKEQAAATVTMTLPGARLLHEGQVEGFKTRLPVFLSRRPEEPVQPALRDFYVRLLSMVNRDVFRNGHWLLCERSGWPDNSSFQNLLAWSWTAADSRDGGRPEDHERYLIVVNLSDRPSQGLVKIPWPDLADKTCRLADAWLGETYDREANDMLAPGLFVDLKPWAAHCFHVQVATEQPAMRQRKAQSAERTRSRPAELNPVHHAPA
jgi:hypothetical protein